MTGHFQRRGQRPDGRVKLFDLLRLAVTGCVGQADIANPGLQVGFDNAQHLFPINRTLEPAAEGRLTRGLNFFPGSHGLFRHRDNAP